MKCLHLCSESRQDFRSIVRPKLLASFATAIVLSCSLNFSVLAQVSPGTAAFQRFDKNGDGKITRDEAPGPDGFNAADADKDGAVTRQELAAYLEQRRGVQSGPEAPARAEQVVEHPVLEGGLFKRTAVRGFSEIRDGMNGVAVADLNRDGRPDIVATTTGRAGNRLRVYLNEGDMRFSEHTVRITGSTVRADNLGMKPEVPNLVDFNGDGFLDIFLTRHRGRPRRPSPGNTLLLSQGAWDVFKDVSKPMGIGNQPGYNRQSSIGDVNGDGWLDIAVGCDTIGSPASLGYPLHKLYVFQPAGKRFVDGGFVDIGGTDLIPDFGGPHDPDPNNRRSGPGITLRDLDDDGDLDLIQSYHLDCTSAQAGDPEGVHEQKFGVWCWKNLLRESGALRFEKIVGNGLATEGQLRLTPDRKRVEVVARSISLPYLSMADVDNDGLLDVLAVGPSSPWWHAESDPIACRFWRNLGGFRFEEQTAASGLDAVGWTIAQWHSFWGLETPPFMRRARRGAVSEVTGMRLRAPADNSFYLADAVFGDFDNDGWQDLVVCNRSERTGTRGLAMNMLLMNNGDGTFRPTKASFSGINTVSICGEAADLNGDGLLDLVFPADPGNSWGGNFDGSRPPEALFESKIYVNTGLHGARKNHWLRLTFSGISHAELIGARVEVTAGDREQYRWIHSSHTYKSGGALDAHFGLGNATSADVTVKLLSGKSQTFTAVTADKTHQLTLGTP